MNKDEFRQALNRNGLSCDQFAALVGRDIKTVYDFGARYPVPYYARSVLLLIDLAGGSKALQFLKINGQTPGNTVKTPGNTE